MLFLFPRLKVDEDVHVRLRRVGTIFSPHDGPGDIPTVAVMAMLINDQRRMTIWRVDGRAPGLTTEKENEVSNGQG